jgi:XrtN system VIT domain protein
MSNSYEVYSDNLDAQTIEDSNLWMRPFRDKLWVIGLVLVLVSALSLTQNIGLNGGILGSLELLPFGLVIVYYALLLGNQKIKWWFFGTKHAHYSTFFVYLVLWFTSCFALNKDITIFNDMTPWFGVQLILACVTVTVNAWKDAFPPLVRAIWCGAMAWSLVIMLYFAIILAPLAPMSVIVCWFFGLSLHSFVPLVFSVHIFRVLRREWLEAKQQKPIKSALETRQWGTLLGVLIPIFVMIAFSASWHFRVKELADIKEKAALETNNQLPEWITMSQYLPNDWLSERMLKAGVVFQGKGSWEFMPSLARGEKTYHDPLVLIGNLTNPVGKVLGSSEFRPLMLKSMNHPKLNQQERLWTGRDLVTNRIITKAEINPALRLAYTEKTLQIKNTSTDKFPGQQEAIYIFQLPEGGTVSSLSLWVNGVEEKARLSGRQKADSAYATIVGREQRDPSIVHWQEGNSVSVRVFPCTPNEDRRVKIGVTHPLRMTSESTLTYENISFIGPPATGAPDEIDLQLAQGSKVLEKPNHLKTTKEGNLSGHTTYWHFWEVKFLASEFVPQSFSFNGKTYRAEACKPVLESFKPSAVYLDLNENWTRDEAMRILESVGNQTPTLVPTPKGFERLNHQNFNQIWEEESAKRFSLFPFHRIEDKSRALVLCKSNTDTPTLRELQGSVFGDEMVQKLINQPIIRVLHLDAKTKPTTYLRALAELRILDIHSGSLGEMTEMLHDGQFFANPETAQSVVIPCAGIRITATEGTINGAKTDHLMRLYAYNDVMRKIGSNYLTRNYEPDALVRIADAAYVVTPVSSLIVLETEADYQRFGLDKSQNSLQNAKLSGAGAVPEPHEWALLILLLLAVGYLYHNQKRLVCPTN